MMRVVCGIIQDEKGRLLIARRPEGKALAGYWEFPGGKIEQGETPESALRRELREELLIETEILQTLPPVEHHYHALSSSSTDTSPRTISIILIPTSDRTHRDRVALPFRDRPVNIGASRYPSPPFFMMAPRGMGQGTFAIHPPVGHLHPSRYYVG
jgi:ADP-ribose pyrophosphatase YjhB (NUDIX family)